MNLLATELIKDRLLRELEGLPEDQLREVLDFVEFLHAKRMTPNHPRDLSTETDSLQHFIGGSSHGSLAQDIDGDLYGS